MREPEDGELPQLGGYVAIFTMCVSAVLLGVCCMCAVKSAEGIAQRHHISPTFVSFCISSVDETRSHSLDWAWPISNGCPCSGIRHDKCLCVQRQSRLIDRCGYGH